MNEKRPPRTDAITTEGIGCWQRREHGVGVALNEDIRGVRGWATHGLEVQLKGLH